MTLMNGIPRSFSPESYFNILFCLALSLMNYSCESKMPLSQNGANDLQYANLNLEDILAFAVSRKEYSFALREKSERDTAAIPIIQQYRKFDAKFDSITKLYEESDLRLHDSLIWHPVLFAEAVNLDMDQEKEIILFIGYRLSAPEMMVFDKTPIGYKKIGTEHLWMHNEYPEYEIITDSIDPIIRTAQFYVRGSGAWLRVNHYHRVVDSTLSVILKAPQSVNNSLGFSGFYVSGRLIKDSITNNGIFLEYSVDGQIDNRYLRDSNRYDRIDIYQDERFEVVYRWDKEKKALQTEDVDVAEYLLNFGNDSCIFKVLQPKLEALNTPAANSFIVRYQNAPCDFEVYPF